MKRFLILLVALFLMALTSIVTVFILGETGRLGVDQLENVTKNTPQDSGIITEISDIEDYGGHSEASLESIFEKGLTVNDQVWHRINGQRRYSLECSSKYYTDITLSEGSVLGVSETLMKISPGSEKFVLYVDDETAKMFGADFVILKDDATHMVATRFYNFSGLTETLTLNKDSGALIDTKTFGTSMSMEPKNTTYLFECEEI